MIVKEVTGILEELAPLAYAEDFDNTGLLTGDPDQEVTGILVTLDTLENVVEEAIAKECNLIVSFHPIIFTGLKRVTGATYVERVLLKAIRNGIAIYSMHTALDNTIRGVNARICEVLGLTRTRILIPKAGTIGKLTTYVPRQASRNLLDALFEAGAGSIGNYSNCSFTSEGLGSFKPGSGSNPVKGKKGEVHFEEETQIQVTFPSSREASIVEALFRNHPYEEVAYETYTLRNTNQHIGLGMTGMLPDPMEETEFLGMVKERMHSQVVRHSALLGKKIQKVAVLGGSGAFAIRAAKAAGADIFITADLKYHDFFKAEGKIVLADIGHYESEQFTKNLLVDHLTKKMTNFAISLSESITNPIKYY